jgi:tetratricopeptide (TPR) repeat protein
VQLLRAAQERRPGEFWLNFMLALAVFDRALLAQADPAEYEEAVRFASAALAQRPDNARALLLLADCLSARGRPEEALVTYRRALEVAPEWPWAYLGLGNLLSQKRQVEEAAAAFRKAITLDPASALAHNLLAALDWQKEQRLDEALAGFQRALALTSRDAPFEELMVRSNFGLALAEKGRFHESAAVSRAGLALGVETAAPRLILLLTTQPDRLAQLCQMAVRAQPDGALPRLALGLALLYQGRVGESLPALRRAAELSAKRPSLSLVPAGRWLRDAERMQQQDAQLAAYAAGTLRPRDRDELRTLTLLCVVRRRPVLAARLHADALAADAAWADDPRAEARYDAARFAALAAAGRGEDAAGLDEAERSRWRRQARQWLQGALDRLAKCMDSLPAPERGIALERLRWWRQEPDLAAVRDEEALANLPAAEQEQCRQLWRQVNDLLKGAAPKR